MWDSFLFRANSDEALFFWRPLAVAPHHHEYEYGVVQNETVLVRHGGDRKAAYTGYDIKQKPDAVLLRDEIAARHTENHTGPIQTVILHQRIKHVSPRSVLRPDYKRRVNARSKLDKIRTNSQDKKTAPFLRGRIKVQGMKMYLHNIAGRLTAPEE